jgi:hypothetical protein
MTGYTPKVSFDARARPSPLASNERADRLVVAAAILSWLLASRVRLYALDRLLDIPNERSSHSSPTPRGGGLAIAVTTIGGIILAAMWNWISWDLQSRWPVEDTLIAAVGWIDDHKDLPALTRFAVQFCFRRMGDVVARRAQVTQCRFLPSFTLASLERFSHHRNRVGDQSLQLRRWYRWTCCW